MEVKSLGLAFMVVRRKGLTSKGICVDKSLEGPVSRTVLGDGERTSGRK